MMNYKHHAAIFHLQLKISDLSPIKVDAFTSNKRFIRYYFIWIFDQFNVRTWFKYRVLHCDTCRPSEF